MDTGGYKTWQCERVIQLKGSGTHRANTFYKNKSVHNSQHIHPAKVSTFCCTVSRSLSSDENNLLDQKIFYMLKE